MTSISTTEHGLPIDESFAVAASAEQLTRAAEGLAARGLVVHVVDEVDDARTLVNELLPVDQSIFTAGSETLRVSGITEDIDESGRFVSARQQIGQLDFATQYPEMKRLGNLPAVVIGSVHAVTEDGRVVITSMTGSQLGPYAAGADKVIWVVGAQKVVSDLETALRRVQMYSLPKEDIRARSTYGIPSGANKTLIVDGEMSPGRITVVLVREAVGV